MQLIGSVFILNSIGKLNSFIKSLSNLTLCISFELMAEFKENKNLLFGKRLFVLKKYIKIYVK